SSSVGSNIFDILVGLPIPWMIKIALNDVNYQVTIKSPFLAFHTILLLFMVVAVVLSIHCLGWKLNRMLGFCMAILYVAFLGIALSVETTQPEWLKF
ncbi:Nckx30C, partial [Symbiodinium pilosum]